MKEFTVGIIGAGRIGKVHAESLTKYVSNVRIKGIADPFMHDGLREWATSMGIETASTNYQDIIGDPEIEAVLICSPTETHSDYIQEAARAGKHIFCEKPIDTDIEKIKETIEVVEQSGVKFQIGFNRRFDHNFRSVRDAVAAGRIGEQHIIRITSRDPSPPGIDYIKVSGGMFIDMTIHDFDMLRFVSGSEVEEVYAVGTSLVDPEIGLAGDVDTAVITLKLASKAIAVIDNSRQAVYGYDQRIEVFGSKGSIETGNDLPSTAVVSSAEGVTAEKPLHFFLERYMAAYSREMVEFIDAVRNDTDTPAGLTDALRPVQIAKAALASLLSGKPEKVIY